MLIKLIIYQVATRVRMEMQWIFDLMESMIITFRFIFILVHGFSYVRQEAPKGELGLYIVSDNRNKVYRMKIRSPD
jgi:NADH:ubiquinone oxidoreductase subunit D